MWLCWFHQIKLDDIWNNEILQAFFLFATTINYFHVGCILLIERICILIYSWICAVCRWVGLMHLCVCVCLWEAADMPSTVAIKVVWRGGVTLNDAWGSLFKVAALCGCCNTNEPLPVSSGTILEDAQAGGASLQVHRCARMCACFAVLGCVRSCWAPIKWGCFPVCGCQNIFLRGGVHCLRH